MRLSLLFIAVTTLLAACGTPYYDGDENSPYFVAPVGSRVILNQELTFAPEQLSIYIQNGRLIQFPQVNTFDPYCKFELYNKSATVQKIAPDEFGITKPVQQAPTEVFFGNPFRRVVDVPGAGGLKLVFFTTRMFLTSAKQPNVYLLDCEHRGGTRGEARITIAEMRQTLAPVITLQLPPPRPR